MNWNIAHLRAVYLAGSLKASPLGQIAFAGKRPGSPRLGFYPGNLRPVYVSDLIQLHDLLCGALTAAELEAQSGLQDAD